MHLEGFFYILGLHDGGTTKSLLTLMREIGKLMNAWSPLVKASAGELSSSFKFRWSPGAYHVTILGTAEPTELKFRTENELENYFAHFGVPVAPYCNDLDEAARLNIDLFFAYRAMDSSSITGIFDTL